MGKYKMSKATVKFDYKVDDIFVIMVDQKSAEFIFIHNNDFRCECIFCTEFQKAILRIDDKLT